VSACGLLRSEPGTKGCNEGRIFRIGDMPYPKSSSNSQEEERTIHLLVVHAGVDIIDSSQVAEQCANCTTITLPPRSQ